MLEENYSLKIQPLFDLGREPLMQAYDKFNYKKFGFVNEDIDELIKLAVDDSYEDLDYEKYKKESDRFFYATIYAIRVLGELQAKEAMIPILEKMRLENGQNDFFYTQLHDFFLNMGVESIEPIKNHLFTKDGDKLTLFECLTKIAEKYPDAHGLVEEILITYLQTTEDDHAHLAFAISSLIDCSGAKHIDLIRETFKTKNVDCMLRGDIEEIEIELGLREDRSTIRPKTEIENMIEALSFDNMPYLANEKIGRNDPCPCGSGKKYKKCCMSN